MTDSESLKRLAADPELVAYNRRVRARHPEVAATTPETPPPERPPEVDEKPSVDAPGEEV